MKNKNGFTLIELLAVIIILAIIAVITVPIVLNVLEKSKKGIAQESAYGYKKAIDEYYYQEKMNSDGIELNGLYKVSNTGKLYDNQNSFDIEMDGQAPQEGILLYEKNELSTGCLTINGYKLTFKNGEIDNTEEGKCNITDINIPNGTEFLFNPTNGTKCTEENYQDNNDKYTNNGCMKWYAYEDMNSSENINLILDHNTSANNTTWISKEDYQSMNGTEEHPTTEFGPITALKKLQEDTKDWSDELIRTDQYTVNTTNQSSQNINYTIDYNGYKAKLISAEEIAYITGASASVEDGGLGWSTNIENNIFFYFDGKADNSWQESLRPEREDNFLWLYTNTLGHMNYQQSEGIIGGYWTSTPSPEKTIAWEVTLYGYLGTYGGTSISTPGNIGIRPVITIPKEKLTSQN